MAHVNMPTQKWATGPLYAFLLEIFPEYRSPSNRFDVKRLHGDLKKSHEAVYKWIRSSRLTPENAQALRDLANTPENTEARRAAGSERLEITIRDFDSFVFAA